MKICVSSYSYDRLLKDGSMTFNEMILKAKEMGFDGIEFAGLSPEPGTTLLEHAKEVKDLAKEIGLRITAYSVPGNLICENQEEEVERLKREVDIAYALGTNLMRHDVGYGPMPGGYKSFRNNLRLIKKGVKEVTAYAETLGIRTAIENHGFYAQDSKRLEMLIDGVNSPNYGALIDLGNFLCVDEDPSMACGLLKDYIFSVHVKDFYYIDGTSVPRSPGWIMTRAGNYIKGCTLGDGIVPIRKCLRILKNNGYNGDLTIEYEGREDVIDSISASKATLEAILREI